jgi:DNA polymerase III epsilon subunit-like protein
MLSVDQHILPWWRLPVAVLDFETCGVDASKCAPVELAVVRFEDGAIAGRWSTLINPEQPIPPEAMAIHGITDEMVADAPRGWRAVHVAQHVRRRAARRSHPMRLQPAV